MRNLSFNEFCEGLPNLNFITTYTNDDFFSHTYRQIKQGFNVSSVLPSEVQSKVNQKSAQSRNLHLSSTLCPQC